MTKVKGAAARQKKQKPLAIPRAITVDLKWELQPINRLAMWEEIGQIKISEKRKWSIGIAIGGAGVLLLFTDLPHPDDISMSATYFALAGKTSEGIVASLLAAPPLRAQRKGGGK